MISKEQAKKVAEAVISENQKKQKEVNTRRMRFAYKPLLGESYLRKYSSEPGKIRQAVKQAQNDSQVAIVFFVFLICLIVLMYSIGVIQNFVVIFACSVGCGVYIQQKISKKAKAILDGS